MADFEQVSPLTASQEEEMRRRIEAVRDRVHAGRPEPSVAPVVDSYDVREVERDQRAGADPGVWTQVMRAHGFTWFEPVQLDRVFGPEKYIPRHLEGLSVAPGSESLAKFCKDSGIPVPNLNGVENHNLYQYRKHSEGQWRRDNTTGGTWAFTVLDLQRGFGRPEAFDSWIREYETKLRLARVGIVVAR